MRPFLTPSLLLATVICWPATLDSAHPSFTPLHYENKEGALLVNTDGDFIDPYFAMKALIVSQDAGLDVHRAALDWINWALPRQRSDGRFDRYCKDKNGAWRSCGPADADDSSMALWLQLLYRSSPDGLPENWQASVMRATKQLDGLRNVRLGLYHVSRRNHVFLFMDNLEVYSALQDIGRAQERFGDVAEAARTSARAEDLAAAIRHVFWDKRSNRFQVSSQKTRPGSFYPDAVAQVFPLITGFPVTHGDAAETWRQWLHDHGSSWLRRSEDPHPWGLVALAAWKLGDQNSQSCWLSRSEPLRFSPDWNILEESVFQALSAQDAAWREHSLAACSKVEGS